jgi:hypothetical protein
MHVVGAQRKHQRHQTGGNAWQYGALRFAPIPEHGGPNEQRRRAESERRMRALPKAHSERHDAKNRRNAQQRKPHTRKLIGEPHTPPYLAELSEVHKAS